MEKLNINNFINSINDFVEMKLNCVDEKERNRFLKSISFWFINIPTIEYYNVINILSKNINASYCCTLDKWRIIAKKIEPDFDTNKVIPKAGSKAYDIIVPYINNGMMEWKAIKVFDYSQLVKFPKGFTINSRLTSANTLGGDIININDYINEEMGKNNFLNEYLSTHQKILQKYSQKEINYIKKLIMYALIQQRVCSNDEKFEFEADIISHNYITFIHDICMILNKLPSYIFDAIELFRKESIEAQQRLQLLSRSERNIKTRINDVKIRVGIVNDK